MMGTIDLGFTDDDADRMRREREAAAAAARAEARALRESSGYGDDALDGNADAMTEALRTMQAPTVTPTPDAPMVPREAWDGDDPGRIARIEARLRAGDAAGIEADMGAGRDGSQWAPPAAAVGGVAGASVGVSPLAADAGRPGAAPPQRQGAAGLGAPMRAPSPPPGRGMVAPPGAMPPIDPRATSSAPQPTAAPRPTRSPGLDAGPAPAMRSGPTADEGADGLASPITAEKARARERAQGATDAELERWDRRIREVQELQRSARDSQTRGALGMMLTNLLMGGVRALSGASGNVTSLPSDLDAFDRRARDGIVDRSREWDATDDMRLRAAQFVEERQGRAAEAEGEAEERRSTRDLAERRLQGQERRLDADAADREARRAAGAEALRGTLDARRAQGDRTSGASVAARARFEQYVAELRQTGNGGVADSLERVIGGAVRDGSATAEQLDRLLPRAAGVTLRDSRRRGGAAGAGGGAGSGGGRSAPAGVAVGGRVQVDALVRGGQLTAEQADDLATDLASGNPRVRAEAQRIVDRLRPSAAQQRATAAATGPELIPGSGIRAGGRIEPGEAGRWRTGYASAQRSMAGLRRVTAIGERYGRTSALSPAARAQIVPELTLLRSMVARMGETGVITEAEVPTINAALPNPNDPELATFGQFDERMGQWRSILEDEVRAGALAMGVDDDGTERLIASLRSGRSTPRPETPRPGGVPAEATRDEAGRVVMMSPQGPRRVPAELVEQRRAQGWTIGGAR